MAGAAAVEGASAQQRAHQRGGGEPGIRVCRYTQNDAPLQTTVYALLLLSTFRGGQVIGMEGCKGTILIWLSQQRRKSFDLFHANCPAV